MEIAMIGLSKMGTNMARRLARGGYQVVAYNRTPQKSLLVDTLLDILSPGDTIIYSEKI